MLCRWAPLLYLGHYCLAAPQAIWLLGYAPFTTRDNYGISYRIGTDMMVDEINSNPGLLPGFEVKVAWQDTSCVPSKGRRLALMNAVREEYMIFAPGKRPENLLTDFDANNDTVVEVSETTDYLEIWNKSLLAPGPVAALGGACSGVTTQLVPIAYHKRWPIISGMATFPGLSDRSLYPNFYRTALPDSILTETFVAMAVTLGHRKAAVVTSISVTWDDQAAAISRLAADRGLSFVGKLQQELNGFRGYRVGVSLGSRTDAINEIVKVRVRTIIVLLYTNDVQEIVCLAVKAGLTSALYLTFAWLDFGWWRRPVSLTDGQSCSGEEITSATDRLVVTAQMEYWRPDSDTTILSCTRNLTSGQLRRKFYEVMRVPYLDNTRANGYPVMQYAGACSAAVCMMAMMLHEMLVNRGITVAALAEGRKDIYEAEQEYLSRVGLNSPMGFIQFEPDVTDPSALTEILHLQAGSPIRIGIYDPATKTVKLNGPGQLRFKFPSEDITISGNGSVLEGQLDEYRECPEGQTLDLDMNTCGGCPMGSELAGSQSQCICISGYFGREGRCTACPPGKFTGTIGQAACSDCPLGKSASASGASACANCPPGFYGNSTGLAACHTCPDLQTTSGPGKQHVRECNCSADSYYTRDSEGCFACPSNSSTIQEGFALQGLSSCFCNIDSYMDGGICQACPRGSSTKGTGKTSRASCLCPQDFYMPLAPGAGGCQPCPRNWVCPQGVNEANAIFLRSANRTLEQVYFELKPRMWASVNRPTEVYVCGSEERCPGGNVSTPCAPGLTGVACEFCSETGRYWDGQRCQECMVFMTNLFIFPILPLMLSPFFICLVYSCVGDHFGHWGSWVNTSWACAFILLSYLSVLGGMADSNMALPRIHQEKLNIYSTTSTVASNSFYECHRIRGIVGALAVRSSYPLLVVLAALATLGGSRVLAPTINRPELKMEINRTFNAACTVLYYFHGQMMGVAFMIFKCTANPSAPDTLAADLSVTCYASQTWLDGLGIGIACMLVYVFGINSLWIRAICTASGNFNDHSFRQRWKFLFVKFGTGKYAWSLVYFARNVCVNLIPCLFSGEGPMLYLLMLSITFYLAGSVLMRPYRSILVNHYDVITGVCAVYVVSLASWWADTDEFEVLEEGRQTTAAIAVSAIPFATIGLFFLHMIRFARMGKIDEKAVGMAEVSFRRIKEALFEFTQLDVARAERVLHTLGDTDLALLKSVAVLVATEVMGNGGRRRLAQSHHSRTSHMQSLRSSGQSLPGFRSSERSSLPSRRSGDVEADANADAGADTANVVLVSCGDTPSSPNRLSC